MKKWLFPVAILSVGLVMGGYILGPVLNGQNPNPIQTDIPDDIVSFRGVVKNVLPAIVSLETQTGPIEVGKAPGNPFPKIDDSQIPEEFRKFFKDFRNRPNLPDGFKNQPARVGFGSGFIVSPDGVVMTNNHVVRGATKVSVHLYDGRKFHSDKIYRDPKTDLAIVKLNIKDEKLPFLKFGDSEKMEIGDRVLAFGAPFGLRGSVTHGIVSAKGRNNLNLNMYEDFLQTDAAINPGNSGGPLVNLHGEVIGINTAIKSRTGGFNGVGLAVASNLAKRVKNALVKDGVVKRGYLGVRIQDLQDAVAAKLGIAKGTGVVVSEVYENTPASKGGLKAGDVVIRIGNSVIENGRALQEAVADSNVGQAVPFEVVRDGQRLTLPVTIEEQPAQYGLSTPVSSSSSQNNQETSLDSIGIDIQDLTPQLAQKLGFNANLRGVVITNVKSGSIGFSGGLEQGQVILKINNQAVTTAGQARDAIANASLAKGILLQVRSSNTGTSFVLLQVKGIQ